MHELSPEIAEQLRVQLDRATAGRSVSGQRVEVSAEDSTLDVMTVREGVIEAMFLVAAVDGRITALEIGQFADGIETIFGVQKELDFEAVVRRLSDRLAAEGWDRRLSAVKASLAGSDMNEIAYRFSAAIAYVDDTLEHAEAAALEAMAQALGISAERTEALLAEVKRELFG